MLMNGLMCTGSQMFPIEGHSARRGIIYRIPVLNRVQCVLNSPHKSSTPFFIVLNTVMLDPVLKEGKKLQHFLFRPGSKILHLHVLNRVRVSLSWPKPPTQPVEYPSPSTEGGAK